MLRYELYNREGQLEFTSGLSGLQLDDNLATLLASPADEAPKVTLYQSSGGAQPTSSAKSPKSPIPQLRVERRP